MTQFVRGIVGARWIFFRKKAGCRPPGPQRTYICFQATRVVLAAKGARPIVIHLVVTNRLPLNQTSLYARDSGPRLANTTGPDTRLHAFRISRALSTNKRVSAFSFKKPLCPRSASCFPRTTLTVINVSRVTAFFSLRSTVTKKFAPPLVKIVTRPGPQIIRVR